MTAEEQELKSFTHGHLQHLSNWSDWDVAFDSHLDQQHKDSVLGLPVPHPLPNVDGHPVNVFRIHWANIVKTDGRRKAHLCMDGSRRAAPWLRDLISTYGSCISQPCMRLVFALSAAEGMTVTFGDTTNVYQQSSSPTKQCCLNIDDAYRS